MQATCEQAQNSMDPPALSADHSPPSLPSSSPLLSHQATDMPAHAKVFLHVSVSNPFWICSPADSSYAHTAPPLTKKVPSFCCSAVISSSAKEWSSQEQENGLLLRPADAQSSLLPIRSESQTMAPSTDLFSTTEASASAGRLRTLRPPNSPPKSCHTSRVLRNSCDGGLIDSAPGFSGAGRWHGLKKTRSKRRKNTRFTLDVYNQRAESIRRNTCVQKKKKPSAITRCSGWFDCENIHKRSSSGLDAASSCVTDATENGFCNSKADDVSNRIGWNGRHGGWKLTSKLDQLALIAYELSTAKKKRSPRKRRRHLYTAATFPPLTLIAAHRRRNCTASSQIAAGDNGNLTLIRRDDFPMRWPRKEVAAGSAMTPVNLEWADPLVLQKKKKRIAGQQTRLQCCTKQVLGFVGKDIIREKLIRQALGNNPDTSKALRLLLDQRKLERFGRGGRIDPYKYKATPYGLLELSEEGGVSSTSQVSCAGAIFGAGSEKDSCR